MAFIYNTGVYFTITIVNIYNSL